MVQVHLVVATPKRLAHLVKTKQIDLSSVQFLILDEADKLFELGFVSHIDAIIHACSNPGIVSVILPLDPFGPLALHQVAFANGLGCGMCFKTTSRNVGGIKDDHVLFVIRKTGHRLYTGPRLLCPSWDYFPVAQPLARRLLGRV